MRTSEFCAGASHKPPKAFINSVRAAGLPCGPAKPRAVTDADLASLPPAVQRYLRFMGVVGRPRDWSVRAHLVGRFRLGPDRPWMPCEAWQYSSSAEVARLFRMRLLLGRIVPMIGWDTYRHGRGIMHGRLLGVFTVARGSGPEFDTSELVTWLNDAILMAPSMLLVPATTWSAGDSDDAFRVSLTDTGRTVSAEVLLNADGAPRDFRTNDRYADLPGGLARARWSTPVEGWDTISGRPRFTGASAVWHLPNGPFRYGELALAELAVNVAPALDG